MSARDGGVFATITFTGAALPAGGVVVTNEDLSDGAAVVQVRQKGIRERIGTHRLDGLTVRSSRDPNRLVFRLSAEPGDFTNVKRQLQGGRRVLVLRAT